VTRGSPKQPPGDINSRPAVLSPVRGRFFRCANTKRPLADWDDRVTSRFSSPGLPVLYLAADWQTAFYEVYGDNLLDMLPEDRAIALTDLESRVWVEFNVTDELHVLNVTESARQREIGADGSTFKADYIVTQPWAHALRGHPVGMDGLQYQSRLDDPRLCLAVFGAKKFIDQGERLFLPRVIGRLSDDARFLYWLLHSEKIAVKS